LSYGKLSCVAYTRHVIRIVCVANVQCTFPAALMLGFMVNSSLCNFVGRIKRMCETDLGIVSQCINPKKNKNKQYFENVALKINVKVSAVYCFLLSCVVQLLWKLKFILPFVRSEGAIQCLRKPLCLMEYLLSQMRQQSFLGLMLPILQQEKIPRLLLQLSVSCSLLTIVSFKCYSNLKEVFTPHLNIYSQWICCDTK